jgi:EamA domain-containing membrane protein RarD
MHMRPSQVKHLRLSTVGICFFMMPIIQWCVAVLVFGEPAGPKLGGLSVIWTGMPLPFRFSEPILSVHLTQ